MCIRDRLNWKQKAISLASHNGDTEHVAAAQSILTESEWGLMQTPLDVPLVQFGRQVRRARRWFHCCSGEHAAILRGLRHRGINRAGYTLPQHPFFAAYLEVLQRYLGEEWQALRVARDGCGLPTVTTRSMSWRAYTPPSPRPVTKTGSGTRW